MNRATRKGMKADRVACAWLIRIRECVDPTAYSCSFDADSLPHGHVEPKHVVPMHAARHLWCGRKVGEMELPTYSPEPVRI